MCYGTEQGMIWCDNVRYSKIQDDMIGLGNNMVWYDKALYDKVRYGMICYGKV